MSEGEEPRSEALLEPHGGGGGNGPTRTFVVVAHRADPTGLFSLQDLAGSGGRWDLLIRCVQNALLVSHGIRQDTLIHLALVKDPDRPRVVTIRGDSVRNLHPDERAGAALLAHALVRADSTQAGDEPGTRSPGGAYAPGAGNPGIEVRDIDLASLLAEAPGLILLAEDGQTLNLSERLADPAGPPWIIMGDHRDLTEAEIATVLDHPQATKVSLGPRSLQTPQCIVLVHDRLDRGVTSR